MTIINDGVQGAKRQTNKTDPLLMIALEILEPLSKKDRASARADKYARQFQALVESDPELVDMVYNYMWTIYYNRATRVPPTVEERAAKRTQAAERIERHKREISMKIEAKAQVMMLDMIMPNGKPLRDCTGRDIQGMEPRLSKVMRFLARTIKPTQKVGAVYKTNEELLEAAKVK